MLSCGNSGQQEPCQSQNSHGHSWQPEPVHRQQLQQKERLQMTGDNLTDGSLPPQQLPSHAGTLGQACSTLPTTSSVASIPSTPSSSSNSNSSSSSSNVTSDSNCSAATSSTPTSGSGSTVVLTVLDAPSRGPADGVMTSIYDLYNTRKMYCIMTVVALVALAVPLSNTM